MLFIEPQAGPAPVLQVIDSARRELDIGVYYLYDRKVPAGPKRTAAVSSDTRTILMWTSATN